MILHARCLQQQPSKFICLPIETKSTRKGYFQFSTCCHPQAARSPRVKILERQRQQQAKQNQYPSTPLRKNESISIQWPLAVLQAAEKSGALSVSVQVAIAILDDLEILRVKSGNDFCTKHGIEPSVLTSIGRSLLHAGSAQYYPTAKQLFLTASLLDDSSATLMIAEMSIRNKQLNIPPMSRQHLERMASEKHPVATYFQGRIYEEQGKISNALKMYEESANTANKSFPGSEAVNINTSDAWRGIFKMKLDKDKEGAEIALKKSAIDFDDPKSYCLLAKGYTPKSSKEYEAYMLKAAASGEKMAADALGTYYFKQSQGCESLSSAKKLIEVGRNPMGKTASDILITQVPGKVPPKIVLEKRKLAKEWFEVGAECNIESSQVHLAILLREAEKSSEGMTWLEKASNSSTWTKTVAWLQNTWESKTFDFMLIDMEKLHEREDGDKMKGAAFKRSYMDHSPI